MIDWLPKEMTQLLHLSNSPWSHRKTSCFVKSEWYRLVIRQQLWFPIRKGWGHEFIRQQRQRFVSWRWLKPHNIKGLIRLHCKKTYFLTDLQWYLCRVDTLATWIGYFRFLPTWLSLDRFLNNYKSCGGVFCILSMPLRQRHYVLGLSVHPSRSCERNIPGATWRNGQRSRSLWTHF